MTVAGKRGVQTDHREGSDGTEALSTEGLVKRFGEVVAVDGVSLHVRRGEVFGFLGPNGAGKTTTIGMIVGLLRPTAGRVRLFGQDLPGNERRLLDRVGALVETPTFYPYLGARDNLRVLAMDDRTVPSRRIEAALELVHLTAAAGRPYRTYSLGMKQRLGIAAALLADPDLVILDEPTNGLDPAGIVEIRGLLRSLAAAGKAVFLSSHQLNEVQQICDRVAIVAGGKIVAEGAVRDLLEEQRAIRVTVSNVEVGLAVVCGLPWVREAVFEAGAITVRGEPPNPFALGSALAGAGVWIGQLTRTEGTLERLFLRLTRDDAPRVAPTPAAANGHGATDPHAR